MKSKTDLFTFFLDESERLQRYAMSRARDISRMDAEDIVSEVLYRMMRSTIDPIAVDSIPGYVFRSIRNLIVDRARRSRPVSLDALRESGVEIESGSDADPAELVARRAELAFLERLIGELPEEYRRVLIATEIDGRSFKELSAEWGVPVGTLLSRKSRAMKMLRHRREELEQEGL